MSQMLLGAIAIVLIIAVVIAMIYMVSLVGELNVIADQLSITLTVQGTPS